MFENMFFIGFAIFTIIIVIFFLDHIRINKHKPESISSHELETALVLKNLLDKNNMRQEKPGGKTNLSELTMLDSKKIISEITGKA